jgi:hypothetical protein
MPTSAATRVFQSERVSITGRSFVAASEESIEISVWLGSMITVALEVTGLTCSSTSSLSQFLFPRPIQAPRTATVAADKPEIHPACQHRWCLHSSYACF